ncbi:MAG: methionine ABC transporter permease [Micrococcaceae bacterium]
MITIAQATSYNTALSDIPGLLLPALGQTLAMVGIAMSVAVLLGTPLGVLLHNLAPGGLFTHLTGYTVISWVANIGRSLPFLVLMAAIIPFTRWVTGTNIGIAGAVVPMAIAGTFFFARLVQNCLREVPASVTQATRASGGSTWQIIRTAQLGEAIPGLIGALTFNIIAMIEYSAIAGTIGAGGLGYVAITYGYARFDNAVMFSTIIVLVLLISAVQLIGDALVRATTPRLRKKYRIVSGSPASSTPSPDDALARA